VGDINAIGSNVKRLLLLAALLAVSPARAAEVFVCEADRSLAFVYDAATQKWDGRMFPASGRTWIVRAVTQEERGVMGLPEQACVVQPDGVAQIERRMPRARVSTPQLDVNAPDEFV